ncbi:MAG TPA: hypothetical protein VMB72_04950 [Acidimicrobiales bacterium]|nr:hypothetical protein [Acidimicrobiales bacterium]
MNPAQGLDAAHQHQRELRRLAAPLAPGSAAGAPIPAGRGRGPTRRLGLLLVRVGWRLAGPEAGLAGSVVSWSHPAP